MNADKSFLESALGARWSSRKYPGSSISSLALGRRKSNDIFLFFWSLMSVAREICRRFHAGYCDAVSRVGNCLDASSALAARGSDD